MISFKGYRSIFEFGDIVITTSARELYKGGGEPPAARMGVEYGAVSRAPHSKAMLVGCALGQSFDVPDKSRAYESARLVFEPLRAEHADVLFEALRDPLVYEHLGGGPPTSAVELREQFEHLSAGPALRCNESWLNFAVRLQSEPRWIGRIQATVHAGRAEVGYLVGPVYWGQGYASESLQWLHNFLKSEHGVSEFWAAISPENRRSIRLVVRAGYRRSLSREGRILDSYEPGDYVFQLKVAKDSPELSADAINASDPIMCPASDRPADS